MTTRFKNDRAHYGGSVVVFPGRPGAGATKYDDNSQGKSGGDVQAALVGDPLPGSSEVTDDTRDRLIRVESNMEHMEKQLTDMQRKVDAMYDLLMQARGMKWLIVAMAAIAGFVSATVAKYVPFLRG